MKKRAVAIDLNGRHVSGQQRERDGAGTFDNLREQKYRRAGEQEVLSFEFKQAGGAVDSIGIHQIVCSCRAERAARSGVSFPSGFATLTRPDALSSPDAANRRHRM